MFKILKDILTTLKGLKKPNRWWSLAKLILGLLTAGGTIALAFASLKSIEVMRDNIKVTKEIADRAWRPEVYYTLPRVVDIIPLGVDTNGVYLYAIKDITFGNAGGSPALELKLATRRNRSGEPGFAVSDFAKAGIKSSGTLRPREVQILPIEFRTTPLSPGDTTFLHIIVWYQDRSGSNYLEETIYYFGIDKRGKFWLIPRKMYEYDWSINSWKLN
jgi:hypothetical protein